MNHRKLGPFNVSAIGLGCMNVSHAYGAPPDRDSAQKLLLKALDLGYTHFDTATMYGAGANETLIGDTLADRRAAFTLASKCGLYPGKDTPRDIDGDPDRIKRACEESLQRLKTDVIDLYYLHRLDRRVPIEDSVGALAELVSEGKIKTIGLSEMSAETLRRAHAVHPITALQTEYSLWTRNAEIAVLDACQALGVTFVAFSPLARGYLSGKLTLEHVTNFAPRDIRRNMPRFQPESYAANLKLLDGCRAIAEEVGCSMAELTLAWVLAKGEHVVAIPGTTNAAHLAENARAGDLTLDPAVVARLDAIINEKTVVGPRYSAAQQADIDTEEFAAAS